MKNKMEHEYRERMGGHRRAATLVPELSIMKVEERVETRQMTVTMRNLDTHNFEQRNTRKAFTKMISSSLRINTLKR